MIKDTVYDLRLPGTWAEINGYINFSFGHCTQPDDGKIMLHNNFHGCREGLIGNMRQLITADNGKFKTDKMRMIFAWKMGNRDPKAQTAGEKIKISKKELDKNLKVADSWMRRGLSVLNACEKHAGWYLTRAYKCNGIADQFRPLSESGKQTPNLKSNVPIDWLLPYYFLSSRRWMKSSYLASLYVLLVRMCQDERIKDIKNFDSLMNIITKAGSFKRDGQHITKTWPYWEALLKGYPKIFEKKKIDYYWAGQRIGNSSNGNGSEGISMFCSGSTSYTDARAAMLKVKAELDKKKKK